MYYGHESDCDNFLTRAAAVHGCGFVAATRAWPDFYLQGRDWAHDQWRSSDARNQLKAANIETELYKNRNGLPTELARINDKYDETLKHYQALVSAMSEAQAGR